MRPAALFTLALLASGAARGAGAAETSDIIVTGLPEPKGDVAYDIVTLTPDRLRASASGRLEDVLRDVAGFQSFRRTDSRAANPTSQGATLRALGGNASSRALVLLDGAPLADPFTGYVPWSALSPGRLGAVRVTRGAGAGAFGTGALAGTIELQTADPTRAPPLQGELDYGERKSLSAEAIASAALGQAGVSLFGRYDRGDGYFLTPANQRGPVDIPASYKQGSVGLHGETPVAAHTNLLVNVLAFDDQRIQGLTGTTTEVKGVDAGARLVGAGAWRWEALGYLQLMNFTNTVAAVDAARTIQTPSLNEYDTPATGWGGKLEVRPPLNPRAGELRLGVDVRDATGHTHELSRFLAGRFTRSLNAGGHERVFGGYAEWGASPLKSLTVTLGGRIDHWSIDDGEIVATNIQTGAPTTNLKPPNREKWEPTARGGMAWDIGARARLRGAAYFGYRLPSLNELYRPFRVGLDATAANFALTPERLKGVEAGIDIFAAPSVRLSLTAFANRLDGAIANVTLGAGPGVFPQVGFVAAGGAYSQRENLSAIVARGVEAEAHGSWGGWRLDASYAYTHARDRASGAAAALNGLPPAQTPAHQLSATLGFVPRTDALLAVTGHYASGQSENDLATRRLTGAATMDALAQWPLTRGVTLILRAENLTNAQIESGISATGLITLASPRTLWVGVRAGF